MKEHEVPFPDEERAKRCPFCGGKKLKLVRSTQGRLTLDSEWKYQVICVSCGAKGPASYTDSLMTWNSRPLEGNDFGDTYG